MSDDPEAVDHPAWPARAWLLMALGAAFGLAFHFLIRGPRPWSQTDDPLRIAGAAFVAVSGVVFAFSLERLRWAWSLGFAAASGLVLAGVAYWNGSPSGWGSEEGGQFAACLLAIAVAVPLFQTGRDEGRLRLAARPAHAYAWSNLILAAAAAAFVLASFLLTLLLAELFKLIGLHALGDLLNKGWFGWMLGCGALGAALGLLRDRDKVLAALQRVVRAVLSFLAPVLALGLVLFVLALPFTGLRPLWEQTKATTPILLFCIAGAVVLANAAIGNSADEEPRARPLRWAAAGLAAVILPLAVVAAISTGRRIGQYGYTPDRLWAVVFVAVAAAASVAYAVALVRGRARWPDRVRAANVRLAAGICLLALFLALPIVSFGAISARDQVARLESGKVSPEKFDWAALRFDFGPAGTRALARLAREPGDPKIRAFATRMAAAKDRSAGWAANEAATQAVRPRIVTVLPGPGPAPRPLLDLLFQQGEPYSAGYGLCMGEGRCFLRWKPGEARAIATFDDCVRADRYCSLTTRVYELGAGGWREIGQSATPDLAGRPSEAEMASARAAVGRGEVEFREVSARRLFVGGRPVGPFYPERP